jgi:5-methylcytosine-specific restriction endonuclease McrA
MAARQRAWARRWRDRLLLLLGNRCRHCRTRKELSFDVVTPCDCGEHHRREWSWRISFYRAQHAAGNLQILCDKCNARKGDSMPDPF